jgi:hypothetical protein
MIVGGWNRGNGDMGHFGVKLDLPTGNHDLNGLEEFSRMSEFKFSIFQPNVKQLGYTKIGDSVNLWAPPDTPTKIFIYRDGTVGGEGRLGSVPKIYAGAIANHLSRGLPIETEIVDVTASTCTIHCRLVRAEWSTESTRKGKRKAIAGSTGPNHRLTRLRTPSA